ncbi:hypothetical protein ALTERO38_60408 [Alteromonas sp. 38]|nr:hypothetical protein ALTERO38_60408 [Alteromonas sp. 38]
MPTEVFQFNMALAVSISRSPIEGGN